MGFSITQFGGGWGSRAGDCCLLTYGKPSDLHYTLIDLGSSTTNVYSIVNTTLAQGVLDRVIFTHLHEDHVGSQEQYTKIIKMIKEKGEIILPPNTLKSEIKNGIYDIANQANKKIKVRDNIRNGTEIFGYIEEIAPASYLDLEVSVNAIVPDESKFKYVQDSVGTENENEKSIGCLITVSYNSKKWRMLTLGDMEPHSAQGKVRKILKKPGSEQELVPVHVIKLPHHGSQHNQMEVIQELISGGYPDPMNVYGVNKAPIIISSGFSKGMDSYTRITNYILFIDFPRLNGGSFYFLGDKRAWKSYEHIKTETGSYFCQKLYEIFDECNWNFGIFEYIKWSFNSSNPILMEPVWKPFLDQEEISELIKPPKRKPPSVRLSLP